MEFPILAARPELPVFAVRLRDVWVATSNHPVCHEPGISSTVSGPVDVTIKAHEKGFLIFDFSRNPSFCGVFYWRSDGAWPRWSWYRRRVMSRVLPSRKVIASKLGYYPTPQQTLTNLLAWLSTTGSDETPRRYLDPCCGKGEALAAQLEEAQPWRDRRPPPERLRIHV